MFIIHWSIIHDWLRTDYDVNDREAINKFLNISHLDVYQDKPRVFLTKEVYSKLAESVLREYPSFQSLRELVEIYDCGNVEVKPEESILLCASHKCFKKKVWLVAHSSQFGKYVAEREYTFAVIDIKTALSILEA